MGVRMSSRRSVGWWWLLAAVSLGCTTQPIGARCEQDRDCNTSNNEVCRSENAPAIACAGSSCICCPSDPALAATLAACAPRNTAPTDGGLSPDVLAPADTGPADTGPADTGPGMTDTGPADTGPADTGPVETDAATDAGTPSDVVETDAAAPDAG